MHGFNPADSYGSVIVAVPDPDSLCRTFATGLRQAFGKLPTSGIPRLLRPRKKYGTGRGFSVVDPGGNWLRVYRLGDTEQDDAPENVEGLMQFVHVASRLGDAHGDEAQALKTLDTGLRRYPEAPRSNAPVPIYTARSWRHGSTTLTWREHPSRRQRHWR